MFTFHIALPTACIISFGSFWAPHFLQRPIPKKFLLGFLLPVDTGHLSKFCKDPFRGVDESNVCETEDDTPYGSSQKILSEEFEN